MKNINKFNAILMNLNYFLLNSIFNNYLVILMTFIFQLAIILKNNKLGNSFKVKTKHLLVLVIFFTLALIMALLGGDFEEKVGATLLVFIQIILIYLSIQSIKNKNEFFQYFCKYFIKFTFILSLYAATLYFLGNQFQVYNSAMKSYTQSLNLFGFDFFQTSLGGDVPGTYNVGSLLKNPNTLSYTCLFAMIMSLIFFANSKKLKVILVNFVIAIALVLSGSRLATLLAVAIIPIYLFITFLGKKALNKIFFVFVIILVLIGIIYNANAILSNINFNGRLELWSAGINNLHIFGTGMNSDNLLIRKVLNSTSSMHNSYISFAVNFGILPLIIFITYIINTINKGIKKIKRNSNVKILLFLLFIFIIFSLSEYTFFSCGSYNALFFIVIYLCQDIDEQKENILVTF